MRLEKLNLFNFRNYTEANLHFTEQVTCFLGDNGSGKTNLLDAIHILSLTKSAFGLTDNQSIRHFEKGFKIKGTFNIESRKSDVLLTLNEGGRKQLAVNDLQITKQATHVGNYPIVMISPYDTDLVRESAEIRRRFLDTTLAQMDKTYLTSIMTYNKLLKNRNALLKSFADGAPFDADMITIYNKQMAKEADYIYNARKKLLKDFLPLFRQIYARIVEGKQEIPDIKYRSDLTQDVDLNSLLNASLKRDMLLQRTTKGVHKDDVMLFLSEKDLKKFGSQGQQKSFVIAMKLAQFLILKQLKGFNPIIMLDDIFDKLDDHRISHLLLLLAEEQQAQLFITDARIERTKFVFSKLGIKADFQIIKNGLVTADE
jgi:DNA replication and repair protein RecF